jgi:hypothetical protein
MVPHHTGSLRQLQWMREANDMGTLEIIAAVLIVLWLAGFIGHIGGAFIHALLVIAVIVFLLRFVSGRRV